MKIKHVNKQTCAFCSAFTLSDPTLDLASFTEDQSPAERDCLAAEMKTDVEVADLKARGISDLKEIEANFTALEWDTEHQQQLLLEQREERQMQLIALERNRIQEREEWERE